MDTIKKNRTAGEILTELNWSVDPRSLCKRWVICDAQGLELRDEEPVPSKIRLVVYDPSREQYFKYMGGALLGHGNTFSSATASGACYVSRVIGLGELSKVVLNARHAKEIYEAY